MANSPTGVHRCPRKDETMMWGYPMGGGVWLAMGLGTLVFVGLIVLVVWALGPGRNARSEVTQAPSGSDALRLLDERLARGDIDPEDYTQRRRLLVDQR
jgi:putative membrane protein